MSLRYPSRLTALFSSFVFGVLLVSFLASSAQAQVEQIDENLRVINATKHDVSEPLRNVDVSALAPMRKGEEENYEVPNEPPMSREARQQPEGFVDPALQRNEGNFNAPAVLQNFDGLGNGDNANVVGFRIDPPDPVMEVGDDFIFEMTNLVTAVYDKQGNLVFGPVPNNAFWEGFGGTCENNNAGDGIVVYDQAEDRWVVSQFANPGASNASECVAISQTSDPSGSYYRYEFETPGNDYPKLGVGTEAYYLSWRDFAGGGGAMSAGAVDKDALLQGDDASIIAFTPSESGNFGTRPPADIDGELPSADTPHPFPAFDGNSALSVWGFDPDFDNPSNSTFEELANISVDAFDDPVCADFRDACVPQPDGPDLETLSETVMHRANVRDLGDETSMVINHTVDVGNQRAGVRWYELRNDGSGWSLRQQGTFAPDDGLHRWMGSIAVGPEGGIALGYTVSGPDEVDPSVRFTGRTADAPLGQMIFEEQTIFGGGASKTAPAFNNDNRWGDYTGMVTDAANPSTFWYVGEYGKAPQSDEANWATRIASFQLSEPDDDTPPETITDLSATPGSATEIDLSWTAPSDPPDGDAATSYDIRYSTDPIENDQDFQNATPVEDPPTPSAPGESESFTVTGLTPNTGYNVAIKSSDIVGNTSDLSNVASDTTEGAPIIATNPDEISKTLTAGGSGSDLFSILNEGEGTLSFELEPNIGGTEISDPLGGNAATTSADEAYPKGSREPAAGAPPKDGEPTVETPQQRVYQPELGETVYYGVNYGPNATSVVSFQGNEPEVLNEIGSYPDQGFANAGDFSRSDDSSVWDLNSDGTLRKIDVETGDIEEVGTVGGDWCGQSTDPNTGTIYAITCGSGSDVEETLYTVNPDVPEVEEVGPVPVDLMIDIAIDGDGTMYGYAVGTDALYEIDKETGDVTEIGGIGFDANFGQGLTWDTKNKKLLMFAFNDATFQGEFRSVDRGTGSTELIGVLGESDPGGTNQFGWGATSIKAFGDWLTATPTEGDVEPGGSQDVDLSFQTTFDEDDDLIGGLDYLADVEIESNDPSTPTESVPVTLTVEGTPAIGFSDDPLDFGDVFAGTSTTDSLSVINESDDAILQVADLQVDNEAFSLEDNSSFVLNPGESMMLPITFSPDDSDTFEGTLSLASSAGDQEVGLVGQGVPFVSIAPDSLDETIDLTTGDSTSTQEFTVTNEFDESLPFDVLVEQLESSGNSVDLTPKLTDEELRRWRQLQQRPPQSNSEVEPSLKPAPGSIDGPSTTERFLNKVQFNTETGVTAYANDLIQQNIVSFDLGLPGAFSVVDGGVDSFAGNFAFANNEEIFWIDNETNELKTYALEDGSVEVIGELEPEGSDVTWTDVETDPTSGTTYVTSGEGNTNRLYELDVKDAELTPVGTFADGDIVVAFGIDDQGIGYAHEIADDEILTVDLETAEAEVLGSTGIDANFAQSMTWDGETGQLLMAALHNCSLFGCTEGTLRQVDRETGGTTAIGSFPDGGSNELGWFATPGTGIPWLATNLEKGVIPAGATLTLRANFDASDLTEGEFDAQISIVGTELQGEPSESLPTSLTVEAAPILFLSEEELGYDKTFVNDTTNAQLVTLRNDGRADMNINSVSIDSDNFAVSPDTGQVLEPGDAQIYEVRFTPQEVGDLSATLSFEGEEVSGAVALTGEGIPAPELAVDPASFERQAFVGQQGEETLDVTNVGEDTLEYSAFSTAGDLVDVDFTGDEFPPEGWFRAGANDGQNWTTPEESSCSLYVPDNSACFYWSPSTEGTQRLITKQLNTTGLDQVNLLFTHLVDHFGGEYELRLETTGDGGETWTTVKSWDAEDLDETDEMIEITNEDVGSDEFHIAWTFDGDSFNINSWGVLDVQVGTPEWLAVDPNEGALTADETLEHTLSIDATGLEEGTYNAAIVANTNDPLAPTASIPFTLNVIEDLAVQPNPTEEEIFPNQDFGVDIGVESLDDLEVFSYELTMSYNPDRVQLQEVNTDGTLSEGLSLTSNIDNEAGTVTIVAADDGSAPDRPLFDLEGQGTLVSLDAQAQPNLGPDTLDITEMVFNEGEPPATPKDSAIAIVPLYGDANLDLSITAQDAMATLDFVAGKTSFSEVQKTHADVSGDGEVSAFDASLILRRTVGGIDCFPVESDCEGSQPALAGKSSEEESSESGRLEEIFAWGEVSRPQTSGAKSGESEDTKISLPLKTDQAVWSSSLGALRSIEVKTEIDQDKVSVEDVTTGLPDDWRSIHHVSDDGTLTISMAGVTPFTKVGKVATVTLKRKDPDAQLEMGGHVAINEGSGHELESKSITSIPDEFALEGTYPNPFRQMATLKMDLPQAANVTVEVYDVLGRKVKTAHNGEISAGSERTVQISGSGLPSGTYFYRARVEMDGDTQTESGKMTVVQ